MDDYKSYQTDLKKEEELWNDVADVLLLIACGIGIGLILYVGAL